MRDCCLECPYNDHVRADHGCKLGAWAPGSWLAHPIAGSHWVGLCKRPTADKAASSHSSVIPLPPSLPTPALCPQGDDYILYCHPQRQKTPRSDRLREWYLTLLRSARDQGVVAHLGNLFDTFFEGGRGHRDRVSASLLPHFDGEWGSDISPASHFDGV